MNKWQKITNKIALIVVLMLSSCSVMFAQSKKSNPFYYTELSEQADYKHIDFSSKYKEWLIPDSSERFEDITHELLGNGYTFERALFNSERFTYEDMNGKPLYYKETSFNGILGDKYARIEIFIHPEVERIDSLTFKVNGKSKVEENICDFTGEIHIEHIYNVWERANDPDSPNYYVMVCNYLFTEDKAQYGTGFFKGTYGAYCYIDKANKMIRLDIDVGGGEFNKQNYVGIWQSYKTKAVKDAFGEIIVCHIHLILTLAVKTCVSTPNTTVLNGNNGNMKCITQKKKIVGGKILRKEVNHETDR